MCSKAFAFYESFVSNSLMLAGLMMGIELISAENSGLYGVTAVYLVTISELMHWTLRQSLLVESLMLSAARIMKFKEF